MFDQVAKTQPLRRWIQHGILLAVSGGADSTALLHGFARMFSNEKAKLAIGHVNHGLRGAESDQDALFVRKRSEQYGLRYFERCIEPDRWNEDETGSREAAARTIRYEFLTKTACSLGFRYIATAHTTDDQIETVLHRILRGTGIAGLSGVAPFRQLDPVVTVVRPLLEISRAEIIDYLDSLKIEPGFDKIYCTDSTNAENDFTRNRIRNVLLPMLRDEFNPKVDDAIRRLADLARDNEEILNEYFSTLSDRIVVRQSSEEVVLDDTELRKLTPATLRDFFVRIWKTNNWPLREMGLGRWDDLVDWFFSSVEKKSGGKKLKGGVFVRFLDDCVVFEFFGKR